MATQVNYKYSYNMAWGSLLSSRFIKRKLPHPMLYEYNLGSYWIQSLDI